MPDLIERIESAEGPNRELDYCDECNGPIMGRSWLTISGSWVIYWIWLRLPYWLAVSRLGFAMLPYVGNIAYACRCHGKNRAAALRARGEQ